VQIPKKTINQVFGDLGHAILGIGVFAGIMLLFAGFIPVALLATVLKGEGEQFLDIAFLLVLLGYKIEQAHG
jgi:hypothetical protein